MILEGEAEELAVELVMKEKEGWKKRERAIVEKEFNTEREDWKKRERAIIEKEVRDEMVLKERKAREGY